MGLRARLFVLTAGAAAGAYLGIRAHTLALEPADEHAARIVEAPVPPPAGLVAEAIIASPDATWRKTQTTIGGFVLLAPPTFGGLLGMMAHALPLASIVDGASPAFAASDDAGHWVVAARAISALRARSALTSDGGAATSGVVKERAGNVEIYAGEAVCFGLAGDMLLVGSDCDAVKLLGPYTYRTLPTKPLPTSAIWASVDRAALAGFVKRQLDARREAGKKFLADKDDEERAAHGGRAPDVADPKPVIAALDALATEYEEHIVGMTRAELALDVDDDGMNARASLFPPSEGPAHQWFESVEGGATAPITTSTVDALATFFWRSGPDERAHAAKAVSDTLTTALGQRVPAADEAKLGDALARIGKARAGWGIVSITSGASPGLLARLAASDAPALTSALEDAIDLARKPTWAKWEADAFDLKKIERTPGHATFTTERATFQASWVTRGGEVDIAAGLDAGSILAAASAQATLASDAKVTAWLRDLRANVAWVLVAHPLLIAASPRSDAALVALSRDRDHVVLHARATGVLVRQLVATSSKGL